MGKLFLNYMIKCIGGLILLTLLLLISLFFDQIYRFLFQETNLLNWIIIAAFIYVIGCLFIYCLQKCVSNIEKLKSEKFKKRLGQDNEIP
jgi:hypothetical protein